MITPQKIAILGWGVAILMVVSGGVLRFSPLLTVHTVDCQVDNQACPDYLQAEVEKLRGFFLFDPSLDAALNKIVSKPIGLKDGTLERQLPQTLRFSFHAIAPQYILVSSDKTARIVISEQGSEVLTDRDDLPHITAPNDFITTALEQHSLPQDFHAQISPLLIATAGLSIQPLEWKYTPPTMRVIFSDQLQAIIPLNESARAIAQLQVLLRHWPLTQVKEPIHTIDLRFKYPVLKTGFF